MHWWDELPQAVTGEILARHPGRLLEEIGIWARRDSPYASQLKRLGVDVRTYKEEPEPDHGAIVFMPMHSPGDPDELVYPKGNQAEVQALIVLAALDQPTAKATRPRQRPPTGLPVAAVHRLSALLDERRRFGKPTQEKIAADVEQVARETVPTFRFDRTRVQQAEALHACGWDLLRSQPEFSAGDGFVYWPTPAKAAQILDSEGSR